MSDPDPSNHSARIESLRTKIEDNRAEIEVEFGEMRKRWGCDVVWGVILGPTYLQIVAGIAAAKAAGVIKDESHCKELAKSAPKIAEVIGEYLPPGVKELVAGLASLGAFECACESVF